MADDNKHGEKYATHSEARDHADKRTHVEYCIECDAYHLVED